MRVPGPPRRPALQLVPVLATALVLAACGGDSDDPATTGTAASGTTAPSSTAPAPSTTTTTTATDPAARLAATATALRAVKSYHFEGTQTDEEGRARIEGDVTADGSTAFELETAGATVRFRVIGTTAYLRADAAYWRQNGGAGGDALARRLADRWVRAPSTTLGIGELLEELSPQKLAACLPKNNGTLRDGGSADVDCRRASVLIDAGDEPGTTPGRLFLAAEGPPLPLRVLQTGKRRPGGTIDPECEEEDDTSSASDLAFSRFDEPVTITAPEDAIEIPGGDGSTTPAPT